MVPAPVHRSVVAVTRIPNLSDTGTILWYKYTSRNQEFSVNDCKTFHELKFCILGYTHIIWSVFDRDPGTPGPPARLNLRVLPGPGPGWENGRDFGRDLLYTKLLMKAWICKNLLSADFVNKYTDWNRTRTFVGKSKGPFVNVKIAISAFQKRY